MRLKLPVQHGDTKIKRKFLWFPVCLRNEDGVWSNRWLEYATIRYTYHIGYDDDQWDMTEFVDGV